MKIYRQGDVLLIETGEIPAEAADVTPEDRIVLAYGEVTGHAHAIHSGAKLLSFSAERFLQVAAECLLQHEEHSTIEIPAGNYKVIQQREYSPEAIRNVAD